MNRATQSVLYLFALSKKGFNGIVKNKLLNYAREKEMFIFWSAFFNVRIVLQFNTIRNDNSVVIIKIQQQLGVVFLQFYHASVQL